MREHETNLVFHSPLGELMMQFVHEKQACGYPYEIGIQALRRLDRFLCESGLQAVELPREPVDRWTAKRSHERAGTQKLRIAIVGRSRCAAGAESTKSRIDHTLSSA
jgi:integrase/recombinase XerD